ncbi:MAG TPA: hypothetical protein VI076_07535 [Actinopolymorphaceae bacterium]
MDENAARTFLLTHARILERRLAEIYLDGSTDVEPVRHALEAYRNADGGFGHGLESDALAPQSQPLAVDAAFAVLDDLAAHTKATFADAVAATIPFLQSVSAADGGLPIVLPSVARSPRAAHWGDGVFPPALNPTAGIVARARLLGPPHPWLEDASEFCRRALATPEAVQDAHTALCVLRFLETSPDRAWADGLYDELGGRLTGLRLFQPMPGEGYGLTPLDFAPTPDSPRRRFFTSESVEAHLDALAQAQQDDGGWPVTWEPPGPSAVAAWRGVRTLEALRVLRAYGRI